MQHHSSDAGRLPRIISKAQLARVFGYNQTHNGFRRLVMTDEVIKSLGLTVEEYRKIRNFPADVTAKIYAVFQIQPDEI